MSDANIRRLELEVEAARTKLATDLSRLALAAYADFRKSLKHEAEEAKDLIIDQAKSTTQSALQDMVDDVKARAAANPAATLWRRYSLAVIASSTNRDRTNRSWPVQPFAEPPARVRGNGTADYLSHAKERLKEQATDLAGEVKDQAAVIASDVKDHAVAMAEAVGQSAQLAGASKEKCGSGAPTSRARFATCQTRPLLSRTKPRGLHSHCLIKTHAIIFWYGRLGRFGRVGCGLSA